LNKSSITAWGRPYQGSAGAPSNGVYTKIYSTERAFAALEANGSIKVWGKAGWGGTGAPDDRGYIKIYSNSAAPQPALPHAGIEPSALRATKANEFE
jgi:hypothetical protein